MKYIIPVIIFAFLLSSCSKEDDPTPAVIYSISDTINTINQSIQTSITFGNHGEVFLTWHATANVDWIQLERTTGTIISNGTAELPVFIDVTDLPPGDNIGTITITSNGGNLAFSYIFSRIEDDYYPLGVLHSWKYGFSESKTDSSGTTKSTGISISEIVDTLTIEGDIYFRMIEAEGPDMQNMTAQDTVYWHKDSTGLYQYGFAMPLIGKLMMCPLPIYQNLNSAYEITSWHYDTTYTPEGFEFDVREDWDIAVNGIIDGLEDITVETREYQNCAKVKLSMNFSAVIKVVDTQMSLSEYQSTNEIILYLAPKIGPVKIMETSSERSNFIGEPESITSGTKISTLQSYY